MITELDLIEQMLKCSPGNKGQFRKLERMIQEYRKFVCPKCKSKTAHILRRSDNQTVVDFINGAYALLVKRDIKLLNESAGSLFFEDSDGGVIS